MVQSRLFISGYSGKFNMKNQPILAGRYVFFKYLVTHLNELLLNIVNYLKKLLPLLFFCIWIDNMAYAQVNESPYTYTGSIQTFTVPANVYTLTVYLWGAGGGSGYSTTTTGNLGPGGGGAYVTGDIAVTPNQVLYILVGQGGKCATSSTNNNNASTNAGGYGGGGLGYSSGGGGGGYSGIFSANSLTQANVICVAGGGGGGASYYTASIGGAGGALNGASGGYINTNTIPGTGGTTSAGGVGGYYYAPTTYPGVTGTALQGGNANGTGISNTNYYGYGGGGGGYFGGGGGGGVFGGNTGGGGSSYYGTLANASSQASLGSGSAGGQTATYYVSPIGNGGKKIANTVGGQNGNNGKVMITYVKQISYSSSFTTFTKCEGSASNYQSFTVSGTSLSSGGITITPPTNFEVSLSNDFSTVGTNSSPISTGVNGGDISSTTIYVRLISSATGSPTGNIVLSNSGTTSKNVSVSGVVSALSVGGNISGGSTVCTGTNSTALTLSGHIGTIIKWQTCLSSDFSTTVTDIANTTTGLTATNLSANIYYRAVVTNGVCSATNSAVATITVSTASVGGSISGSTSVCTGTNTATLTLNGYTGTVTKWQSCSSNAFASGVSDIVNTTNILTATNLLTTNYYRAVVKNGACSAANSAVATIDVSAASVGGSISGSTSVCTGTNSASLTLSGYTGTISKWQSCSSSAFATGVSDIVNTTTSLSVNDLSATNYYRAIITNGACTSTSSLATITVSPVTVGGNVSGSTQVCSGSNSSTLTLNGYTGDVVKWQSSNVSDFSSNVIDLNNTTNSLIASNLTSTTFYRAVIKSGACITSNSNIANIAIRTAIEWSGNVSSNWSNSSNWICGVLPAAGSTVIISNGLSNYPALSGNSSIENITITSGASLTINNGYTLSVSGDFNNLGTLTNNGTISLNGTAAQAFPGAGTIAAMNILQFNNAAGITLNNNVTITNQLMPTLGTFNLANNDITLKSTATATASISAVGSSAGFSYGTGRFVVERFVNIGTSAGQHSKSWQLIAAPTQGTQTIQSAWMEGGSNNSNPNSGYGIIIGGPAGTAGGFDMYTPQAVMKTYDPATNTFIGVSNPTTTNIANAQGYMVFIRGDRSITSSAQSPVATTLRTRGTLQVGSLTPITIPAGKYQSFGNPYPSAIDFSSIATTGLQEAFYLFDPSLQGYRALGGYQTISAVTGTYRATPNGTSIYGSSTTNLNIIQSGQGFYVKAIASADGTLTFAETNKISGSRLVTRVNGPSNNVGAVPLISTNLLALNGAKYEMADGNAVVFDDAYSNAVDNIDALKPLNGGENFGLVRDAAKIAVEARKALVSADTIFYDMSNIRQPLSYKLQFIPENLSTANVSAELIDKFLNTRTPVSLADTNYVNITTSSNALSYAKDRFMLVFHPLAPVPVLFTSIAANRNTDNSIAVEWRVQNELNMDHYELERSADGRNFATLHTAAPLVNNGGSAAYPYIDATPLTADNYYRVKALSVGGRVQYSAIVKVAAVNTRGNISVYPNPIESNIVQVVFTNQKAGHYSVQLINSLGQVIYKNKWTLSSGNQTNSIELNKDRASGVYRLQLISDTGVTKVILVNVK